MRIDVAILGKGKHELRYIKAILDRLNIIKKGVIGLIDCQEINNIPFLVRVLLFLCRIARKMKCIAIVIDADSAEPKSRFQSIIDGLRQERANIGFIDKICFQTFSVQVKINNRTLTLITAVNKFNKISQFNYNVGECLEDHVRMLLLRCGVKPPNVKRQLIQRGLETLKTANKDIIKEAFPISTAC